MQELHVVVLIFMAESFIYHPMDLSSGATATAADILNGKTAVINGEIVTGTMTNRGNVSATLNAGGSYTIPVGYHAGGGTVRVNSLASQTAGTATAADIISGKTAWVNGVLLTGNAAPGSQVATGTAYIDDSNFSFSCGFRPSQFVVFMYSTDSEYQWGGMLFISMYYNGNTSYEYGLSYISGDSYYFGSSNPRSVSLSSSGASITLRDYTPYLNGTPIRWVAWS